MNLSDVIYANLAKIRFSSKSLGGYVALDKVDVRQTTLF